MWIADDGTLEAEGGVNHQTCPSTYKDPRMPAPCPERCVCGVDVASRARDLFALFHVIGESGML